MSKRGRLKVQVTMEGRDYERDLSKKRLTEQEIRDHLPAVWKDRAEVGRRQIALPIRGTGHYS